MNDARERRRWREGYGVIRHGPVTVQRIEELVARLDGGGRRGAGEIYRILADADRLTSAAMWLVAHMTYARRVDTSGSPLPATAFKQRPEGHTGGSLNMVPAFVGYLAANALSGCTRAWVMGQGHCVAAIEAVNALTGDVSSTQAGRYDRSEAGLSALVADFYGFELTADGRPAAPISSHLGPHTAGAVSEGGYLGLTEVQYMHMPLPGERLVAFLSDGAFEEQRGSDWAARWWRAEDCGLVTPVMILNGRRLEERSEIAQEGGARWLERHLKLSGFDPRVIDGRDPAAFAWAILDAEARLEAFADDPDHAYPAALPHVIAETVKGFGFPGAGTNRAHNLPLSGNPAFDEDARAEFNAAAARLFVPTGELAASLDALDTHAPQGRPRESAHPLAQRRPPAPVLPVPDWCAGEASPMDALDAWVLAFAQANRGLRFRLGNPDELGSNHMPRTLDALRHRVNAPEPGAPEAVHGSVITALNEEAVAGAALGNKGGLNLIVSYEAFAPRMLGALRQEITFARQQRELGQSPGWISVPLIATSHAWENSKNAQSHQDPTIGEALLGEMSDTARVLFPIDANSAMAALSDVYAGRGRVACLVTAKRDLPCLLDAAAATELVRVGATHLAGDPKGADLQIVAIGAYQVIEALKAHRRLAESGRRSCVTVIIEPGRFRSPRDPFESQVTVSDGALLALFPPTCQRLLVTHTRPEPLAGLLQRLRPPQSELPALGYINRGGTLDVAGMLRANRCTSDDILAWAASRSGQAVENGG